jgi:tetratricopeptide (TPR) repeat protein
MSEQPSRDTSPQTAGPGEEGDGQAGVPPLDCRSPVVLDQRDYQLLEELGRGGMGEVHLSRDPGLDRPLALKVMRAELAGDAHQERRFAQEAHVTGSLQHPGIVPVHNLGRLPDGRLYFTMKVVRGRTLAHLLGEAAGPAARLGLLDVFAQVCQAVAYAHSRGVIHRDLKPANVMVGAFGEVQVMDWGLAKVLAEPHREDVEQTTAGTVIRPPGSGSTAEDERGTGVVGTPAYMAPEQARAEGDAVDERADVFGLGAILCVILTGQPPFLGRTGQEVQARAARGDVAEALARQRGSGAEAELVSLACACLCPERDGRPRTAGAVAQAVSAYQAGVQERLRRAERERAAAEARAVEERKRRRVSVALAGVLLMLVVAGGVAGWLVQQQRLRQGQADRDAAAALKRGGVLLEEGWRLHDLGLLTAAKAAADQAVAIARNGGAAVRNQAAAFQQKAGERVAQAGRNRVLMDAVLNVSGPQETRHYEDDGSGRMVALALPSPEEQYAAAFKRWGLDVEGATEAEAVARLREEPEVVVQELIAALDTWMLALRRRNRPAKRWRRLFRLAQTLDESVQRRQLRSVLAGQTIRLEVVVDLLGATPPWPALGALARGDNWLVLQEVRGRVNPATESALTVVLLAQALANEGDAAGAEQVLHEALARRPGEVVLLDALGKLLERQGPGRLGAAIECYRAIRARRPLLGVALGLALGKARQWAEGEAVLRDLIRQQPNNPEMHLSLGYAQWDQKKVEEAVAAYRKAIALKPDYAMAHNNLGAALRDQKKVEEAVAAFRKAIDLKPDLAPAHYNLGVALADQKKMEEAVAAFRKAIAVWPDYAKAHNNLGLALRNQKKVEEAVAAFRKAISLKPDSAKAHNNLGLALADQKKMEEAVAAFRKAISLQPDLAEAHYNLGLALADQKKMEEAVAAFRKAIAVWPDYARAHNNLGAVLRDQKKLEEAVAACRKAIDLKPDYAEAHSNLGAALHDQKKVEEAVAAFRKAIALQPDLAEAHFNLGVALRGQSKVEEAVAAFRKAIALKPDSAKAHNNLGVALRGQSKVEEAVAAFRKAIALKPDSAEAHNNLGLALHDQRKVEEAVAAFRKAIVINPDYAEAHCNLGAALRGLGTFTESLTAYQRGHELGLRRPGWPYSSAVWVARARRLVELDRKLSAVLAGEANPSSAAEQIELAALCHTRQLHATAARFFADAFAADARLAENVRAHHRYNAARSAALALAGKGKDAPRPDKEQARFRQQALGWLRANLTWWTRELDGANPQAKAASVQAMQHWQSDPDLAAVRDRGALEKLPEDERQSWQKLWADVASLHARASAKK